MVLALLSASPSFGQKESPITECDYCRAEAVAAEDKPPESFWERATDDPTAAFTGVLAVLTAALVGVTLLQIKFLIKADEVARIAADAAKKAADAAVEQSATMRAQVDAATIARAAEEQRLNESLQATRTAAEASRRYADAAVDQAGALRDALRKEEPVLFVYGLGQIKAAWFLDEKYYEISYSIINVGRAPAIILNLAEGVQPDINGEVVAPVDVPTWHKVMQSPVIGVHEVITTNLTFPAERIAIKGCYLPDSGGYEPDYYIPEILTPAIIVEICYRGAVSRVVNCSRVWKFEREHAVWVDCPSD